MHLCDLTDGLVQDYSNYSALAWSPVSLFINMG